MKLGSREVMTERFAGHYVTIPEFSLLSIIKEADDYADMASAMTQRHLEHTFTTGTSITQNLKSRTLMQTLIAYSNVDIERQEQKLFSSIDLNVVEGEFVYLIGKVGSGKSSLLKTFYAELPIAKGKSAKVFDYDLLHLKRSKIPYLRRQLGIIFQDFQLLTDRTVEENLEFVLRATGWTSKSEIKARIEKVLAQVGMENRGYRMPNTLSGGEQQRIVIARALLNSPKIILADEPTGNLDPETANNIVQLLYDICHTQNTTVIMSTHNLRFLDTFPGRVLKVDNQTLLDVTKKEKEFAPLSAEEQEAEDNLLMGIALVPIEEKPAEETPDETCDNDNETAEKEEVIESEEMESDEQNKADETENAEDSSTDVDATEEPEGTEESAASEEQNEESAVTEEPTEESAASEEQSEESVVTEEPTEESVDSPEEAGEEDIASQNPTSEEVVPDEPSPSEENDAEKTSEEPATDEESLTTDVSTEETLPDTSTEEETPVSPEQEGEEPTEEKIEDEKSEEEKIEEKPEEEKVTTSISDIDWDAIQRAFEEKKRREFQSQLSQMVDKINPGQAPDNEATHE